MPQPKDTRTLYHVTQTANIPAIMREGLAPRIGVRSLDAGETTPAVYLFPDVASLMDAMCNWLGDCFGENEPLTVLTVDARGLRCDVAGYEARVYGRILPDRLTVDAELSESVCPPR